MRMLFLSATALVALSAMPAAAVTIEVTPWLATNGFGSPSYNANVANAITGLHDGVSVYGPAGSPTQFVADGNHRADEVIVTGFTSWKGQADPGNTVGAAYASELGNRMHFGFRADCADVQCSMSQLAFSATSTDPFNALAFSFGAGAFTYNLGYQGVLKGDDGLLWTEDDVFITGGANTQYADGLVGRGPGNSFAAYCPGCTVAQQQAAIMDVASYAPYDFTGTFTLGQASGSGTHSVAAVPEPGTWALMILGFGGVGTMLRSRRHKIALA